MPAPDDGPVADDVVSAGAARARAEWSVPRSVHDPRTGSRYGRPGRDGWSRDNGVGLAGRGPLNDAGQVADVRPVRQVRAGHAGQVAGVGPVRDVRPSYPGQVADVGPVRDVRPGRAGQVADAAGTLRGVDLWPLRHVGPRSGVGPAGHALAGPRLIRRRPVLDVPERLSGRGRARSRARGRRRRTLGRRRRTAHGWRAVDGSAAAPAALAERQLAMAQPGQQQQEPRYGAAFHGGILWAVESKGVPSLLPRVPTAGSW